MCNRFHSLLGLNWGALLFFLLVGGAGLAAYRDYGISWDEYRQRNHGSVAAVYLAEHVIPAVRSGAIFSGIPAYPDYPYKSYPVLFHMPVLVLEKALGLHWEDPELWKTRHLYTFLWFYVGLIFFYKALARYYGRYWALLGCLMLVLHPRIFADAFYNVKDLAFLSAVLVSLYAAFRYMDRKDVLSALILALAVAVAINVRIMGVLFYVLVIAFSLFEFVKKRRLPDQSHFAGFIVLVLAAPAISVMLWPASWENPVRFLVDSFITKSAYPWLRDVLFMGEFIPSYALPWYYIPTWIAITTPIPYIVAFIVGACFVGRQLMRNRLGLYENEHERAVLFCLVAGVGPVVAVIAMNSIVYDGWRHLYFIAGPMAWIGLHGVHEIVAGVSSASLSPASRKRVLVIIFTGGGAYALFLAGWMIINHPYQYVYFNPLAGNRIEDYFERDYWLLSSRHGLEFIVRHDDRDVIRVNDDINVSNNILILSPEDRARLQLVDREEAEYIVEHFRWRKGSEVDGEVLYSAVVGGITLMSVYKGAGAQ